VKFSTLFVLFARVLFVLKKRDSLQGAVHFAVALLFPRQNQESCQSYHYYYEHQQPEARGRQQLALWTGVVQARRARRNYALAVTAFTVILLHPSASARVFEAAAGIRANTFRFVVLTAVSV